MCQRAQPCRSPPLRGVQTGNTVRLWMATGSDWASGWGFLAWHGVTGQLREGAGSGGLVYILVCCPGARPAAASDTVETWLTLLPRSSVIGADQWHRQVNSFSHLYSVTAAAPLKRFTCTYWAGFSFVTSARIRSLLCCMYKWFTVYGHALRTDIYKYLDRSLFCTCCSSGIVQCIFCSLFTLTGRFNNTLC